MATQASPHPAIHKLSRKAKVGIGVLALLIFGAFAQTVRSDIPMHYGISIDPQYESCLPWSNFLVHYEPPKTLHVGELVLFHYHKEDVITKGDKRILVVKYVAALPGDTIRIQKDGSVWIDGKYWGKRWLIPWAQMKHLKILKPGTYTVQKGHVLMMGTTSGSYDGRYWGTVPDQNILGRAWVL